MRERPRAVPTSTVPRRPTTVFVRGSGIEPPAPKKRVRPDATSSWVTPASVARKRLRFIPVMRRTWV